MTTEKKPGFYKRWEKKKMSDKQYPPYFFDNIIEAPKIFGWMKYKNLLTVAGIILATWFIAGLALYGACQLYLNHIKGWF